MLTIIMAYSQVQVNMLLDIFVDSVEFLTPIITRNIRGVSIAEATSAYYSLVGVRWSVVSSNYQSTLPPLTSVASI